MWKKMSSISILKRYAASSPLVSLNRLRRSPIHRSEESTHSPSSVALVPVSHSEMGGGGRNVDILHNSVDNITGYSSAREKGISQEELQQSYADHMTQVAPKSASAPASVQHTHRKDAKELLGSVQYGFSTGFGLFRDYLRHLATVLVTAVIVLLASSLRGEHSCKKGPADKEGVRIAN
jgi:hypothetical protein